MQYRGITYCGDGIKISLFPWPPQQLQYKNFLPFLSKFVYSKLFELYLIFHHGTTPAKETKQFAYGSAMVLLADDLADDTLQKAGSNCIFKFLEKTT